MGATKLLDERLVTAANKYSGEHDIGFSSIRFGNVVNPSQSVIPVFQQQMEKGETVTFTDPQMTRFFLTCDDVVVLIVGVMNQTEGGEVFAYKMVVVRIDELAEAMIETFALTCGYDPEEIEMVQIGRSFGETFDEEISPNGRLPERSKMIRVCGPSRIIRIDPLFKPK